MPSGRPIPLLSYGEFSRKVHDEAAKGARVIKAQLELTYRCNLHCRHCYTDPYNAKEYLPRELSVEEIERLLIEMRELGIVWLNLTGGDIFMHPRFFDMYESAYRKGFLLQLYTNGTLFTEGIIERFERMPPFTIDVSVHSVDEERFDWFTQVPGSFRAFIRGMELLRASSLPVSFKTKAMNWNRDELPHIRDFVESFGQRFSYTSSLSPRLNGDCGPLEYRLPPADVAALEGLPEWVESRRESCAASISTTPSAPTSPDADRLYRCGCGTDTIHINAWGELGACTLQYEHRASLRAFHLAEAIDRVFDAIRTARYRTDSPCRICDLQSFCDKKPSDARWERGATEAPIPYDCDLATLRGAAFSTRPVRHPLRPARTARDVG